jgi:hypothetical protein
MDEPLTAHEVRVEITRILGDGTVVVTSYCERRMHGRKVTLDEVYAVLRGGATGEGEWEKGAWRYHVWTQRLTVVVQFEGEMVLVVVTCWTAR